MRARLREEYQEKVVPVLRKKFSYRNTHEVPKLTKVVVNMGVGEATQDPKLLDIAVEDLAVITGQRPLVVKARKSISQFKLRKGVAVGCKVTLRGNRMYEFFDRLVNVAMPRIRDFRGVPRDSFDGRGNYTFGIKEQVIFPEIPYDKVKRILGADITIVTTARTDEESSELLSLLGMPFRRK
jgi:large subunit ribosomal protein L5